MEIVGQTCLNLVTWTCGSWKWRSAWPVFHRVVILPNFDGEVILPYILKTIWCMYIILCDYESIWPEVSPQNKCRSLWPIFHGPVILPHILKTIWCMNIIIRDCESVWPDVDLKINVGHCVLYFMVHWFLCYILKTIWSMNIILCDYGSVWPDIWHHNKCMLLWPIFHGPVMLPYISKTIW